MEDNQSLYEALGILPRATQAEIKRAYRTIAKKHHPDKTGANTLDRELFERAATAYKILSDEARRREYDTRRGFSTNLQFIDLFKTPYGQRLLEIMLPHAPSAPRPGGDALIKHRVKKGFLRKGGVIQVKLPKTVSENQEVLTLHVPATDRRSLWCRVNSLGYPGTKNGQRGDLWIVVQE